MTFVELAYAVNKNKGFNISPKVKLNELPIFMTVVTFLTWEIIYAQEKITEPDHKLISSYALLTNALAAYIRQINVGKSLSFSDSF